MKLINFIRKIIAETTSTQEDKIDENTSMENLNKWDSLAQVKIILSIEKKYKKVKTSDLMELTSVKKIINYLKKNN